MKRTSLIIKATFSLVLVLVLAITMVLTSPGVAFAQNTPNSALKDLEEGIKFEKNGDLVNAEFFYKNAIDKVLANKEVDVLIVAKLNLAKIKQNQGHTIEANQLNEEADAGEKALRKNPSGGAVCGPLCSPTKERRGSGATARCHPCGPG
jgi:hypothetical protein